MKNYLKHLSFIFFVLFFISCGEDNKPTNPKDNPNTIKASVSGDISLDFDATAVSYNLEQKNGIEEITITGTVAGSDIEHTISIIIVKVGGKMNFSTSENNIQFSYIYYNKKDNSSIYYRIVSNGTASFEKLTEDLSKGTFSFEATPENQSKKIVVSAGIIDFDKSRPIN